MMLLLLQATAQQLPPVYVTLQTPPGMPFWETTMISAVVGTFFGIASSVGMEFVKPVISNRIRKKVVLKSLDEEFCGHFETLLDLLQVAKAYDSATPNGKDMALTIMSVAADHISTDRFTHFRETEKVLTYEADEGHFLGKFYIALKAGLKDFPSMRWSLEMAEELGTEYIKRRGLPEIKSKGIFTEMLKLFGTKPSFSGERNGDESRPVTA
jgi:hypothetical protein